ncbi:MAG: phosphatase PAP2 family protein [Longimicrobiales bacterium]
MKDKPAKAKAARRKHFDIERTAFPEGVRGKMLRLLYSIFRFIARHFPGFWSGLAAFLTMSFLVSVLAVAIFGAFARLVQEGLTQSFDVAILKQLASIRSPFLDRVMLEITALGGGSVLFMMVAIAALFLWLTDHKWSVYLLIAGVLGGQLLNQVLKLAYHRERPSAVEWGQNVTTLSFPSGHAMTSTIAYGCIAYLVGRLGPTPRVRGSVWGVALVLICAIGLSRMYLGVHYPSDVLAGFFAGVAWLAFVASGLTAVEFFAARRPKTKEEEQDLSAEKEREAGVRV